MGYGSVRMPVGHLGRRSSWSKWRGGFSENGGGVARKAHEKSGVDGRVSPERNFEGGASGLSSSAVPSAKTVIMLRHL
jgi:hypothetical protein